MTMLTAPTGWISLIADRLAATLAACHAFRNWTGTEWTIEQALARIHHNALPPPTAGDEHTLAEWRRYRPHALIWTADDGLTLVRDTPGPGCCVEGSGDLILALEHAVPASIASDPAEVDRRFENFLGRLCGTGDPESPGLMDLVGDPRYLPIRRIRLRGRARTAIEDLVAIGDAQRAWLEIHWATNR